MKEARLNLILQLLFPLAFFMLSMNLPFWGDSIASVSKPAVRIFEEGLNHPWNYINSDPGHPTLFPWLIALCWKIFGYHLWVPHLLISICLFVCARLLYLLSSPLSERSKLWFLLLVFLSPVSISQAIEISLQLPLTLFFLASFRELKRRKYLLAMLWASLMMLIHIQAVLLLAVLALFELWKHIKEPQKIIKSALYFLIPSAVFGIWCGVHYLEFGWALFTPNFPRQRPGIATMAYNLGIMAWRYVDLGYFIIGIPALFWVIKKWRKSATGDIEKIFLLSLLILCFGISILFVDPPSHRYIFPVYLFGALLFIKFLESKSERNKYLWIGSSVLILLSGSLWYYPGKCLGDQNLVFLNYHELEEKVEALLPVGTPVYSYAPLNNDGRFSKLETGHLIHHDLYGADYDTVPFILQSNLTCEFGPDDLSLLEKGFSVQSYESWGVYLNLWVNSNQWEKYPNLKESHPRKEGKLEKLIYDLKRKIKP